MRPNNLPYRPDAPTVPELASGAVVADENGPAGAELLLLHHREEDRWCLPKGHVDPGESLVEAALREVREESGLSGIRLGDELVEISYRFYAPSRGVNVHKSCVYFLARTTEGRDLRLEPTFDLALWVSPERALELVPFESDRAVLRAATALLRGGRARSG